MCINKKLMNIFILLICFFISSEDFFPIVTHGDRTLSAYRIAIAEHAGSSCSTGIIQPSEEALQSVISDWFDVFERVQLILRLSGRLRKIHND